ncbi:Secondary metabolism regulator [Lachnellula willkommii]|uniref:Diphthamide biosynthesis protein 4 n=1 Tax=Lachnellula willkommii TaxID=215461 RepID=A0A559M5R8_9HELO|nr:Secondary metabolism regulator [Lachnellula willkommii]
MAIEDYQEGESSTSTESRGDHAMADGPANAESTFSETSFDTPDSTKESALQHLDVDDTDDRDSALGGMTVQTSTMSVDSSIYNYVQENGRTYHKYKEGKYMLPNDEAEIDRLELQHQLWLITLYDELTLAQVKNPQNVLDFATGTGEWAIDFAIRFPSARVIGSDLSPIQPNYVPPNCYFEIDDMEDEWTYTQKFDLVHGRALMTCLKDPAKVFASAFNSLVPGGYLELQDIVLPMRAIDDTLKGTAMDHWATITTNAAAMLGISWKHSGDYGRLLEEAGFVDVVESHFQWPTNTWPKGERMKLLGRYWQEDLLMGLESVSMAVLTRGAGFTMEQVLELTAEVRKDVANKNIHAYMPAVVVLCNPEKSRQHKFASDGSMPNIPTHYEILDLPETIRNEPHIPAQTLRGAYRRALLQNHPDKAQLPPKPTLTSQHTVYSIDQISEAFSILSDGKSRAQYDKELKLQNNSPNTAGDKGKQAFRTGVETVDLDDLEFDEAQEEWYRSCRCGDERGFLIEETDLEEAAEDGELNVGCKGCSLWLKVLFGVIEEDIEPVDTAGDTGDLKEEAL